MREIKFRAWDFTENKMMDTSELSYGVQYNKNKIEIISQKDCFTFMQYTGLKDKNGASIYEGDIVKIGYPYTETNAEVIFNNGQFYPDSKCETIYFRFWASESEVIGSIYENPELLKS